jgi:hypothetical protein
MKSMNLLERLSELKNRIEGYWEDLNHHVYLMNELRNNLFEIEGEIEELIEICPIIHLMPREKV